MRVTLEELLERGMSHVEAQNMMNYIRNEVYAQGGKVVRIKDCNGQVVEQLYELPC
ncbi:MAG: hypothetical protein ACRDCE_05610 [Cetobacterium sp.]|uniref:hypothetical protein n=1 Tax=Cetobacterium sp. TaxID=2071632 RepID=UPI003EE66325